MKTFYGPTSISLFIWVKSGFLRRMLSLSCHVTSCPLISWGATTMAVPLLTHQQLESSSSTGQVGVYLSRDLLSYDQLGGNNNGSPTPDTSAAGVIFKYRPGREFICHVTFCPLISWGATTMAVLLLTHQQLESSSSTGQVGSWSVTWPRVLWSAGRQQQWQSHSSHISSWSHLQVQDR